ncbi:MAG: glycoside hydrolase family 9 protein [Xenococcaceae cyanobacterium]
MPTNKPPQFIKVDQFGYRPQDTKVAVIVDPQFGINSQKSFSPGKIYEVVDAKTGKSLFSAPIAIWNNGKTQQNSGDRGWWFDFSSVNTPGSYYIRDKQNNLRSYSFEIANNVYQKPLKAAMRTFFYQRLGFAKKPPYADRRWQDDAAFLGRRQDTEARYIKTKSDPRDMRGGWQDAGDTNKYVTFAHPAVHQLLSAYTDNRKAFTDDFNIPESGNGIPDLIDEVKFEIDWLKRMQDRDGGVFIKLGTTDYTKTQKPSQDRRPRFYGPKCSSATIAAASMYAHASIIFAEFQPLQGYAKDLENRAIKAWKWYQTNPKRTDCDNGEIKSGDADRTVEQQKEESVVAAVYLSALTRQPEYSRYVSENMYSTRPWRDNNWSCYDPDRGDALLFYSQLPNTNKITSDRIKSRFQQLAKQNNNNFGDRGDRDLYRSHVGDSTYHWGSFMVRANCGNQNFDVVLYNIDSQNKNSYRTQALGILHYFHGVNPLNLVYLSNMSQYGAENSINEIYHEWFGDKSDFDNALTSRYGPAPGYVPGGPNKNYTGTLKPPKDEPPQKAYRDFNGIPEKSWEITEPAIYYQAAYVKLLSKFVN